MASLNLANPKMMDVAVPANIHQGLHQEDVARKGWAFSAERRQGASRAPGRRAHRPAGETGTERTGAIPGSLHAPDLSNFRTISARAASSTSSRGRARRSSSIAHSASARRWRCRRPRIKASRAHGTSRAACRRGRRPAARRIDRGPGRVPRYALAKTRRQRGNFRCPRSKSTTSR